MLSPLAVLSRGYALVYASNGSLLRNVADITRGEAIRARLAHGILEATVSQIMTDEVGAMENDE